MELKGALSVVKYWACGVLLDLPVSGKRTCTEVLDLVDNDLERFVVAVVSPQHQVHLEVQLLPRNKSHANLGVVADDCLGEEGAYFAPVAASYRHLVL